MLFLKENISSATNALISDDSVNAEAWWLLLEIGHAKSSILYQGLFHVLLTKKVEKKG